MIKKERLGGRNSERWKGSADWEGEFGCCSSWRNVKETVGDFRFGQEIKLEN